MTPTEASWFHVPRPVARPRVRLFCFPHAGGNATMFHKWPRELDADVELLAIQLPGRAARARERPFRRMTDLVPALAAALQPRLDVPFAFFGHSLGAVTAFEVTRLLRQSGGPQPLGFFPSAHSGPQLPRKTSPIHHLAQDPFLRALEERYGIADGVLKDPEMAALAYPWLRADMEILETWVFASGEPIAAPIAAFGGVGDRLVDQESLDGWASHTTGGFSRTMFQGDHFYLMANPAPLLVALREKLADAGR